MILPPLMMGYAGRSDWVVTVAIIAMAVALGVIVIAIVEFVREIGKR